MRDYVLRDFSAIEAKKKKEASNISRKVMLVATMFFSTCGVVFVLNTIYTLALARG
ncbi:MAG: hypothetical protein ACRC6N_11270 [Plesiomonas sp.]|uniref:hypothetical protein n=1 Tax=Plesiomonas sp. TaxID=2486279 RepID=UPI003F33A91D